MSIHNELLLNLSKVTNIIKGFLFSTFLSHSSMLTGIIQDFCNFPKALNYVPNIFEPVE